MPPTASSTSSRLPQGVVDLGQRPRDLRGAARAEPDREHAQVHAAAPSHR